MTLILENTDQIEYHTNLHEIVEPFSDEFTKLNWLLTDIEFQLLDSEQKGEIDLLSNDSESIIISGVELYNLILNRNIQFIWGVFCGFNGVIPHLKNTELPFADMNSDIWTKPEEFLIQECEIEIICFDGSATIFKSKNEMIEIKFKNYFSDAKILK